MIDRIAAAPISWGICEVPGWGLQMSPSRILGEMAELGITKTELGALGWLPDDLAATAIAARRRRTCRSSAASCRWSCTTARRTPVRSRRRTPRPRRSATPAVSTSSRP